MPNKYLRYDLQFADKELEHEYEASKKRYYNFFVNIIIIYGFLIGIVGWGINPFKREDQYNISALATMISLAVLNIFFMFFAYKKPHFSKIIIIVLITVYFFGMMELTLRNQRYWNKIMHLLTGTNMEFIALPMVLAKVSWKFSCILLFIFNMFLAFRYTNFNDNYEMNFYPLIQFIQNTFLLGLSAYFVEKFDRESFYKIHTYEYSLACFKDLITKAFPSAVIIMRDERIIFNNQKTLSILECKEEGEIYRRLENLKYENALDLDSKLNKKQELLTTEENKPFTGNENMINIIDASVVSPSTSSKRNFQKFFCGFFQVGDKKKSFEITMTKIIWEHEKAMMIIISENDFVEKLTFINEQSEYKDILLATVSHDLRTPLCGIMGMIRMTLEMNDDDITKKYLNVALRSSQLLLLMINDILDYSQISNGKLRLNFESFSLWEMIKDVAKLFKFQAKMKGIAFEKLSLVGSQNEDSLVKSDQNRIKQVLFNLLGNALKFTLEGKIKITLKEYVPADSCEIRCDHEKAYLISVQDTGIGIKKEDQANLFKLFGKIQNESTNTLNKSGVGLGLAISQSLVKILNKNRKDGEITVESEINKGSCFSLVLFSDERDELREEIMHKSFDEKSEKEMKEKFEILERELDKDWQILEIVEENNMISRTKSNKMLPKIIKRQKNILIVDDDQINILVMTTYLKTFKDYIFDAAFNGEEAIKKIKSRAKEPFFYDIILMDCNMPILNGFEAAKIIQEMIAAEEIPPVVMIACTANASPKDYELCFKNGMIDSLTKPFSKDEMRAKIEKYF